MSDYLFTSESVSAGHPDKVADQISDAILDAIIAQDPVARVACETFIKTGVAIVGGEITTKAKDPKGGPEKHQESGEGTDQHLLDLFGRACSMEQVALPELDHLPFQFRFQFVPEIRHIDGQLGKYILSAQNLMGGFDIGNLNGERVDGGF